MTLEEKSLTAFAIVMGLLTISLAFGPFEGKSQPVYPRLVGYGCNGASGPLYANEEDEFPAPCYAIEENK
jgi:hypothetical protein